MWEKEKLVKVDRVYSVAVPVKALEFDMIY